MANNSSILNTSSLGSSSSNSINNTFGISSNTNVNSVLPNVASATGSLSNSSKEFLNSNTMISKIVFLIIIIIFFMFLFRIGFYVINYLMSPSRTPILIDGMINGQKSYIIEVDPNMNGSKPIYRSNDESNGIEFTYNSWIYIDNIYYQQNKYQHIWHKGDDKFDDSKKSKPGVSYPNNCPGVYIKPNTNVLSIFMNSYDNVLEEIEIDNIPVSKWICLTLRVQNKTLDIYFNGSLIRRHTLTGIPRQNYGKIWCAQQGGFGGYLSKLQYWDYAINYNKIQEILRAGPNLKLIGENTDVNPPYLAMKWYYDEMQGFNDANPILS